jgi:hypothetical protein
VEPLATMPPSRPVAALSITFSLLPLMSWRTSREASAQFRSLRRQKLPLTPHAIFDCFIIRYSPCGEIAQQILTYLDEKRQGHALKTASTTCSAYIDPGVISIA